MRLMRVCSSPRTTMRTSYSRRKSGLTPLPSGAGVVSRIFTNLAVVDITPDGFQLVELAPGISADEVRAKTGAPIRIPD